MDKGNMVALERKLSPLGVGALALGCIIGWGAFVMPGNTFLLKGGPLGTAIAMGIGGLIMIDIALNYAYMINRYPIAGGEFAYVDAELGRRHAFACSWFLGLCYLAIVPLNATALALVGRSLLPGLFQVGFHYVVAGYDVYAGEVVLAIVALVVFALLSIRGVRVAGAMQAGLVLLLVGSVALVCVAAIVSPQATLDNLEPAFAPGSSPVQGVLAIVAVAPWAFVGFDTVPQAAEEFSFPPARSRALMIVGIVSGTAIYIALNTVTAVVVPDGYASWAEYVTAAKGLGGVMSLPTFHAALQLLGAPGLALLGVAVTCAVLSGLCGFYMATSRLLFSMGREGVLPGWFSELGPRSTPRNAILFVMTVAMVAPFFGREALGWIVDMSSLGAAVAYGYTSFVAYRQARREGDHGIVATGVLGLVLSAFFAVLLLVPVPGLECSLGAESMACLGVWAVLGLAFYASATRVS